MKTILILATLALCSCAELGPLSVVTKWGSVERDADGNLVLTPTDAPIVIPAK